MQKNRNPAPQPETMAPATRELVPATAREQGIAIRLIPSADGSMELQKTARGLEFKVSETQLRFITVCLDIARFFNDGYLKSEISSLRDIHACPEQSRWYRNPIIAAETNRRLNEWCTRSRAEVARYKAAQDAKPLGL